MNNDPAIAAVFELPPGRYREYSIPDLYRKVLLGCLEIWKPDPSLINGLLVPPGGMASLHPDVVLHERLADELGLELGFAETLCAGGASYGLMIQRASMAIASGLTDAILCLGAGTFPETQKAGDLARILFNPEFETIYGPTVPAMYALLATRHMAEYGTTQEQLAAVAVSARRWALLHPHAFMRNKGPLTKREVMGSRLIASPFHLYDCSVPCSGGGAVLVTSGEIARKLAHQPAYIGGMGEFHSHGYMSQSPSFSSSGGKTSAASAMRMAGFTARDIDLVEIYDAFTINPIICLEDLGFCDRGMGGRLIQEGRTDPGGDLPMNTYGGLLSYGHVGDASGLSMIVEGSLQIMGLAGERQVEKARTALIHTYGGMMTDHSTLILSRDKPGAPSTL